MGFLSNVGAAETSEGGNYIHAGLHEFEIAKVKAGLSKKEPGVEYFAVDLKVISSKDPITGAPVHGVGTTVSFMAMSKHAAAQGNVKQFVEAVLGGPLPVNQKECEEAMAMIVGVDQPFAGKRINCEAVDIETKAKRTFTKCKFSAPKA